MRLAFLLRNILPVNLFLLDFYYNIFKLFKILTCNIVAFNDILTYIFALSLQAWLVVCGTYVSIHSRASHTLTYIVIKKEGMACNSQFASSGKRKRKNN